MTRYRAIFFDFDGVLVDSVDIKTEAFRELYGEYGTTVQDRVAEYHLRNGGVSRFEKIRYYHREYLGIELTSAEIDALAQRFSALVEKLVTFCPEIAGATAFLERRHRDFDCFVISGTPEDELRRIVENRGLSRFFLGVYGSPARKADILRRVLAERRLAPTEAVMVGDSRTDLEAARETGVSFLGCRTDGTNPFGPDVACLTDLSLLDAQVSSS